MMVSKKAQDQRFDAIKTLGISDARRHFSEIIDSSINIDKVAVISRANSNHSKRAFLIGERVLSDLFNFIRFDPIIETVKGNIQISYDGFSFYGIGSTKEEAIMELLEDVRDTVRDYFSDEEYEMNMQYRNTREKRPYFLKLAYCEDDTCLIKALGLQH